MTDASAASPDLRQALIDGLRSARVIEHQILEAFSPEERDAPAADGGWSPKDVLAHLSAWRRHEAERLAARRQGTSGPEDATETDAANAVIHAERAQWSWNQVLADANAAAELLIAEVEVADDATLAEDRVIGSIMGNGPEHDLSHLPALAARVGLEDDVEALAAAVADSVAEGGWPTRSAAFARYNLACYHALGGRLDDARRLLRLALPASEELRTFALGDSDLVALRDELPTLERG